MTSTTKRRRGSTKSATSGHGENNFASKKLEAKAKPVAKSKKKLAKMHGLAAQEMVHSKVRNKLFVAVVCYIAIGVGVLYWRGVTTLPEIPLELENEILESFPQQLKDLEMPKAVKSKSSDSLISDDNEIPAGDFPLQSERRTNESENENSTVPVKENEETSNFEVHIQDHFSFSPILTKSGKVAREWKEVLYKKHEDTSSVRIFVMDNFLSSRECDGLMKAHDNHMRESSTHQPVVCFSDERTMKLYLRQANVRWAESVSRSDFTAGTRCLNESYSGQLEGKLPWSHSTSFYPGESPFSSTYERRVQRYTGFDVRNGGKFQVTSYDEGIGYKLHTDCVEGNTDLRDRFATILVYLQDVEEGGETEFTELGVKVRPKKGRALVWNNMDSQGRCDLTSYHQAAPVVKGKKYILQRWYYYQNFPALGKRFPAPVLPPRSHVLTPRVSCDRFDSGSCRWYDEWNYDHLTDYSRENAV